jgi:ElaB/YqjD/DUF883 family membrane-anchored ribosome-binding protein
VLGRYKSGVVDLVDYAFLFLHRRRARHDSGEWNFAGNRALYRTSAAVDPSAALLTGTRSIMARKTRNTSQDVAEIEREIAGLMRDLEDRVGRLNTLTRKGASHAASEASDFVSETLSDTADRLRNGAHAVTDEATRLGTDALRRVEDEVEQRPLLTLAIAAGIGFLAGMAGRRH